MKLYIGAHLCGPLEVAFKAVRDDSPAALPSTASIAHPSVDEIN